VDQALLNRPTDPELRFLRGVLLADLGRTEAAMAAFVALNQDFPELPDPLNNLAVLYAARGELERARELLESALRNEPRHLTARENLGDVYLRLAIREWQAVSEQTRPEPALTRKLALARQLVVQLADRP
jgi:Flp pilus assembly protein TadD